MKMMVLDCIGVIKNSCRLNFVTVLPCTDGAGDVPPPNIVSGSVPVVPLVLERDPDILLID